MFGFADRGDCHARADPGADAAPPATDPPLAATTTAPTIAPIRRSSYRRTPAEAADGAADDDDKQHVDARLAPLGLVGGGVATAGVLACARTSPPGATATPRSGPGPASRIDDGTADAEIALRAGADPRAPHALDDVDTARRRRGNGSTGLPRLHRVEASHDDVTLVLDAPAPAPPGFLTTEPIRWESSRVRSRDRRRSAAPAPALVPVGAPTDGTEILSISSRPL